MAWCGLSVTASSTAVLSHTGFAAREEFDQQLSTLLRDHKVELVILAGFMRLLSARFIQAFPPTHS